MDSKADNLLAHRLCEKHGTALKPNQICQWYCCSCGQSYGTILYREYHNDSMHTTSLSEVKYYSSLVYQNSGCSTPVKEEMPVPELAPIRNNETNDNEKNYVYSSDSFAPETPPTPFVVDVPYRFDCHRCEHMMCPYCPKIRYQDLYN